MRRPQDLDAVTLDAYGTLVRLRDPVPALSRALADRGVRRAPREIREAFAAEVAYYLPRSHEGRDEASLADLRERCAAVFLRSLGVDGVGPASFAPAYVAALELETLPGIPAALRALAARGLALAVVSNWDVSLAGYLAGLGLGALLSAVVTSAEAGVPKPDPAVFELALGRLGVDPGRALHVGDLAEDEHGARVAGMAFAPAPLQQVTASWS